MRPLAGKECVTVHVAPYMGGKLLRESSISAAEVRKRGSLPAGLFEQVSSGYTIELRRGLTLFGS